MSLTPLTDTLLSLAERYERKEFLVGDPSWFMHRVEGATDKELLAFIAASLSYGSRRQFMPKIQLLLTAAQRVGGVTEWLLSGEYNRTVPPTDLSFYRLYTCRALNRFLRTLAVTVETYGSLRGLLLASTKGQLPWSVRRLPHEITMHVGHVRQTPHAPRVCHSPRLTATEALEVMTAWFREHGSGGVVPQDTRSSCKRLCMFLRWMVRTGSPVDLGLWADIINRDTLIMPMDTHVVQEAMRLGLLTSKSASMANAIRLTRRMAEIFPGDPLRGDYALFGLGADKAASGEASHDATNRGGFVKTKS